MSITALNKTMFMNNVDKFLNLFADFELVIEARNEKKNSASTRTSTNLNNKTKSDLEKALKRLVREYKSAQRSFKTNKITKQELFDFEWRIFEIQEELKRLEEDGNDYFEKD